MHYLAVSEEETNEVDAPDPCSCPDSCQDFRRRAEHVGAPFIELRSIAKSFGPVEAIRNVSQLIVKGVVILVAVCIDVQTKKRHG